jgi:hypothetical protein
MILAIQRVRYENLAVIKKKLGGERMQKGVVTLEAVLGPGLAKSLSCPVLTVSMTSIIA